MMFPPQKKKPAGGPPPQGGAGPDPMRGGAGAPLPFGPGPGGPPPAPSRVKPGQGMDPFQAMTQGLGPDVLGGLGGPPQGPGGLAPMGPGGLPIGGSMPQAEGPDGAPSDMGGSDLLQALAGAIGGGGDPYATGPFPTSLNVGTQDPNMGLEQMLQALALAQMGVGGQPGAGGSGVPFDQSGGMGQMIGM
jgi:hypothetical protein